MVVRSWSELDFDNVCSNAKVFGFDLDNTLASSKQPMKPAMIERFCALLDHTVVALISGGGMAVVTSQVLDVLTPNARRGNLHVMPTSGSRYYRMARNGPWCMRMICPKPPWPLSRKVLSDMPGNWDCGNSRYGGLESRTGAARSPSPLLGSSRP